MEMEQDSKAKLVGDICSISNTFITCTHRPRNPRKQSFVDWYLILQIEEDCGEDQISKRYRRLALQLHPDKNHHPNADVAFRLVSEAYTCLTDEVKRKAFNTERCNSFCANCINKNNSNMTTNNDTEKKRDCPAHHARRGLKRRMSEEYKRSSTDESPVFNTNPSENHARRGLKRKMSEGHNRSSADVYPVFNPSDSSASSPGYLNKMRYTRPDCFRSSGGKTGRTGRHECPIFENKV